MNINLSSKTYLILLLLLTALITWGVFIPGFFFHHDDLQVMRIFEMRKCFDDLQIPCRWVPDMGYGNGYPLFNYYSALPYYIGTCLSYFLGFVNSAKALFFIPLVLGGVSMYFLSKELFGKEAGFISAILYGFAPYRALDIWVRGAISESFAMAIIPLVFYFFLKIIKKPTKTNLISGSLLLGAFLLCHNITTMFFMPLLILWSLMFLYFEKWKNWKATLSCFLLGIGISGFFLLPVFWETKLVQTGTLIQGGGNFRTHFVTVYQLFLDRFWGYGGSQFGPNDTISFQIGWPHWWLVIIAIPFLVINFKKNFKYSLVAGYFFLIFLVSIFMTHNKSAFIWEAIGPLQYAQFPWRFLSLAIFSASMLAGLCFYYFNLRFKFLLVVVVALCTILLNWNYFQPREFYPWINDQNKLADPLWEIQQKAGILDYLPKTAYEPQGRAPNNIEVLSGKAEGSSYDVRSNKFSVNVHVLENAYVQVPVFDFPNWTVYVNGQEIDHNNTPGLFPDKSTLGRIGFMLEPGNYEVKGVFKNTPVRTIGNSLTIISLILLLLIFFNKRFYRLLT